MKKEVLNDKIKKIVVDEIR